MCKEPSENKLEIGPGWPCGSPYRLMVTPSVLGTLGDVNHEKHGRGTSGGSLAMDMTKAKERAQIWSNISFAIDSEMSLRQNSM